MRLIQYQFGYLIDGLWRHRPICGKIRLLDRLQVVRDEVRRAGLTIAEQILRSIDLCFVLVVENIFKLCKASTYCFIRSPSRDEGLVTDEDLEFFIQRLTESSVVDFEPLSIPRTFECCGKSDDVMMMP